MVRTWFESNEPEESNEKMLLGARSLLLVSTRAPPQAPNFRVQFRKMDPEHKRTRSLNDRDDLCDSVIGETLELGCVKSLTPTKIKSLIIKNMAFPSHNYGTKKGT